MMKLKQMLAVLAVASLSFGTASAMNHPVTIADQGSFMAGGRTVTADGTYDGSKPTDFAGETLHGDHAYVFYQKPVKAKKYGMVFLHGYGQARHGRQRQTGVMAFRISFLNEAMLHI